LRKTVEAMHATKDADNWVPDPERLAKETADLLRFGTRVLTGLALAVAGALAAAAVWLAA
jgi:hypothetical protein